MLRVFFFFVRGGNTLGTLTIDDWSTEYKSQFTSCSSVFDFRPFMTTGPLLPTSYSELPQNFPPILGK